MNPTPKSERLSIVVVGQFNPAIVTPAWLEREELISRDAEQAAEIEVIAPEVASFTVAAKQVLAAA